MELFACLRRVLSSKSSTHNIFLKASITTGIWFDSLNFCEHSFCFLEHLREVATNEYFHDQITAWSEEFFGSFEDFEAEHRAVVLIVVISSSCFWSDIRGDKVEVFCFEFGVIIYPPDTSFLFSFLDFFSLHLDISQEVSHFLM